MKKAEGGRHTVKTHNRLEFQILMKIVKKTRTKAKISQRKLSEMIGRHESYIGKFELGDAYPDFATALDMLQALGLDPAATISEVLAEVRKQNKT